MLISLSDNGGRRVKGDRRQMDLSGNWEEKRTTGDRRKVEIDRRSLEDDKNEFTERRAINVFKDG